MEDCNTQRFYWKRERFKKSRGDYHYEQTTGLDPKMDALLKCVVVVITKITQIRQPVSDLKLQQEIQDILQGGLKYYLIPFTSIKTTPFFDFFVEDGRWFGMKTTSWNNLDKTTTNRCYIDPY